MMKSYCVPRPSQGKRPATTRLTTLARSLAPLIAFSLLPSSPVAAQKARDDSYALVKRALQDLENHYKTKTIEDLLCISAATGNVEAVKYLLSKGVSINARTTEAYPVFWVKKSTEGFTPASGVSSGFTALCVCVLEGRPKERDVMLKFLLRQPNIDANAVCDGMTALHYATVALQNESERWAFDLLLNHSGIDINCRNREGKTPLMLAITMRNASDIAVALIRNPRANLAAIDEEGNNAFVYALAARSLNPLNENWNIEVINALQKANASWPSFPDKVLWSETGDDFQLETVGTPRLRMANYQAGVALGAAARRYQPRLGQALDNIDIYAQPNEPDAERKNRAIYLKGYALLLNRLVGTAKAPKSLYASGEWRTITLPAYIKDLIRDVRELENASPPALGWSRKVRLLNAALVDYAVTGATSPRFQ